MSLDRRLCRLERVSGDCSVCGTSSDVPDAYEVVWDDTDEGEGGGPEYCEACGRQTVFVVGWADLEEMEPDGVPGGGR